jgi:hypothetical protein
VILIVLNLLSVNRAVAQDVLEVNEDITAKIDSELKLKVEFTHLMQKVSHDLDLKISKEFKPSENPFDQPEKLTRLLKEESVIFRTHYEETLHLPKESASKFRFLFDHLDWGKIVPFMKRAHLGIEVFFKRKGLGIGIAVMAGVFCEYMVPAALIHLNLAHFIPISMITPWATIYSFVPGIIQKAKINSMLLENLGSKSAVEAYKVQQKEMSAALKLLSPDDLMLPVRDSEGEIESVIIHHDTRWKKIISKIGFENDFLNLINLKKFISENNISDSYINWILEHKKLSNESRISLIVLHLYTLDNQGDIEKFELKFKDQFLKLKSNNHWEEVWQWTKKMKRMRNINDVLAGIDQLPKDIKPLEIATIWEDILLPEYIKYLDLSYSEARIMFNHFEVLKAKLHHLPNDGIEEKYRNEIFTYLKKIIGGKQFRGCKNSSGAITKYLLKTVSNR